MAAIEFSMFRGTTPSAPISSESANWQAGNRDIDYLGGGASRPSSFFGIQFARVKYRCGMTRWVSTVRAILVEKARRTL